MGLQWGHNYYIDISVAFGYKPSGAQILIDTIGYVMTSQRYTVFPNIDDTFGILSAVDDHKAFDTMKALVDRGLQLTQKACISS